ncbi:MAG: cytochrome c oxidase subunit II [Nannocystaceae bacterium]
MTPISLLGTNPNFWMPDSASTVAPVVDAVYYALLVLCVLVFAIVLGAVVYFVARYRHSNGASNTTSASAGSLLLHLAWVVIPGVTLVLIFHRGVVAWSDLAVAPGDAVDVRVTADDKGWQYDLVKAQIKTDALVVPVGRAVKLTISSGEGTRGYAIPAFRVNGLAVPGQPAILWFEATKAGSFDVVCSVGCDVDNAFSEVRAMTSMDYRTWEEANAPGADLPPKEYGEMAFADLGCVACHSATAEQSGKACPPLGGTFGTQRELADGSKVLFDDAYLIESLTKPGAKVAKGFQPVMPSFEGRVSDRQLEGLTAYLKSLK